MRSCRGVLTARLLMLCICILMPFRVFAGNGAALPVAKKLCGWNAQAGYTYLEFGLFVQEEGVEPLHWRVLTVRDGKALLLTEKILDSRFFGWSSNEWEGSELQWWLNENFVAQAFSQEEAKLLAPGDAAGRVQIPMREDMLNPEYGFQTSGGKKDAQRRAQGTKHAIGQGLWVSDTGDGAYYTRTKGSGKDVPTLVTVRSSGDLGAASIERDNVGVRPMLWLDLNAAGEYVLEGEGTQEAPYCFVPVESAPR